MKSNYRYWITYIIAAAFILLFTYAAVSKLADYQKFTVELGKSPLLVPIYRYVGWIIPSAEILISLLLLTERFRLAALYASFSLMVMFTAYLITVLKFSDFVPCTCGGVLEQMSWYTHIIFNICFVVLAAIAVFCHDKDFVLQYDRDRRKPAQQSRQPLLTKQIV